MLKIEIHSTRAVIRFQEPLTVGLRGAKARFSFGAPWAGLIKTAVFRQGEKTVTVADIGQEVTVPWEVLTQPGLPVQIGVYGIDSAGQVAIPTVWTVTQPVHLGADPEGDPSAEPTPGLWEQLQGKIGSLEQLQTEDKTSLVQAVNEVKEQIPHKLGQLENDSGYLTEAPVTSVNGQTGAVNIPLPTKTSELVNDSGFLTAAPVTSVNGQTGAVTLPTTVEVTLTQKDDGSYETNMSHEEILAAHNQGNTVHCRYSGRLLSLIVASMAQCSFGCVHSGNVYTVTVFRKVASVKIEPLASGGGDGITPHIGENGNWFIGETDTGMPSRGEPGTDGKSAYQYALDGGYTGTEAEFADKLAADLPSGGGNANICNFTVTSEQEVNGITVELPTTLNKFYMINFHIQFASGLTGEMVLYSHQGDGYWKGYNDRLPEGTGEVSLFGLFYNKDYLTLGMRIAPFGVMVSPAMGDIALPVSQNDKTITFFSDTVGVNFPAGSSISVWGVYEQ